MTQTVDVAVSDRPVKPDSQALADWVNRECVPILKKLRDAINGLDDDGATPGGPAGGQLTGTYPDPSVVGVTESGGPTALTMGAVTDGQYLKRSGSTVVGATLTAQSVSMKGFRSRDQGGAFVSASSRVHFAGLHNFSTAYIGGATTNTLQSIGAGQMCYAYPEYFEKAGTINRLVIRTNGRVGTVGTPRVKMGVYSDSTLSSGSNTGSPYPGARLGQTGDLDIDQSGANRISETVGLTISVAANTYVWFVIVFNNQAVTNQYTVPVFRAGTLYPVVGFTFDPATPTTLATDSATGGVGWRHAITYGTTEDLPDPFPQSAPAILTGSTDLVLPAIGYGFQP